MELNSSMHPSKSYSLNSVLSTKPVALIPLSPQHNGVVERKHQHLLEVARALKIQSRTLEKYWSFCVLTTCYLINVFPSTVLHCCSPYEALYKRKFDAGPLRVFGWLCFATNLCITDKFCSRSIPVVMLGYAPRQKGYILLNIQSQSILIGRDIIFREHIYPFKIKANWFYWWAVWNIGSFAGLANIPLIYWGSFQYKSNW